MSSGRRVLLLSPMDPAPRPDSDLAALVVDLLIALRSQPGATVEHAAVFSVDEVRRAVATHRPDVVFNACETLGGDADTESLVPSELDRLGIPFTGSAAPCLELCLRKSAASEALRTAGVTVPALFAPDGVAPDAYPVIVKPDREDGSIGIHDDSVARDETELRRALESLAAEGHAAIIQQYVEGREIAVALLGWPPRVLSPGEIVYDAQAFADRDRILTYASKWDPSSTAYRATRSVGAALSPTLHARLADEAVRTARALGMRDYGRVDFRVDRDERAFVIDVNPNCDLSADAGFMRAAGRNGIDHAAAIGTILEAAWARASTASAAREHAGRAE